MLTIKKLNEYGANALEGLERCLNNEAFYFKLIDKAINNNSFDNLKKELEEKNYDEAFNIAHSLKGVLGNLSLTPLYEIVFELTELLRARKDIDYSEYIERLLNKREELILLMN